jgi:hypothetical protein
VILCLGAGRLLEAFAGLAHATVLGAALGMLLALLVPLAPAGGPPAPPRQPR